MAIAMTLKEYLANQDVPYDLLPHPHTSSSSATAHAAHVSGDKLLKSVMLQDEKGLVMAVLPATHRVELGTLYQRTHRNLGLASEMEFAPYLEDCELGAIPPVGPAYGIETIVDDSIEDLPDLYFEAGDHKGLVHMRGDHYLKLLRGSVQVQFTHRI